MTISAAPGRRGPLRFALLSALMILGMVPGGAARPAWAAGDEESVLDVFRVSEMRAGIVDHDTGLLGNNKEEGFDVSLEARFQPLTGWPWDDIWHPRPHIGANFSTAGGTSSLYTGLTWIWRFGGRYFFSVDLGGAIHDGKRTTSDPERKELGTRLLFREAIELGIDLDDRFALSVRFDHISNANIASENEGLDTAGVFYTIRF